MTVEKPNIFEKKEKSFDNYKQIVIELFLQKRKNEDENYIQSTTHEQMKGDLQAFIQDTYGNNILQSMLDGKVGERSIDVAFQELSNQAFTIVELLNSPSKETIITHLETGTTEQQAVQQMLTRAKQYRDALDPTLQTQLDFSGFLTSCNIRVTGTPAMYTMQNISGAATSLSTIASRRKSFVQASSLPDSDKQASLKFVSMHDHINTEKLVCIATIRNLGSMIDRIPDVTKRQAAKTHWKSNFGQNIDLELPVSAFESWITMPGLVSAMDVFFSSLAGAGFTPDEIKQLQQIRISYQDVLSRGTKHQELPADMSGKSYSQLSTSMKDLANSMYTIDMINNVDGLVRSIDKAGEDVKLTYTIPATMKDLFMHFGLPSELNIATNHPDYKRLSSEILQLRQDLLVSGITDADKTRINTAIDAKITEREQLYTQLASITRPAYFTQLKGKVDTICQNLGVPLFGSSLEAVLVVLQGNNRNIDTLDMRQKNIIMQTMVLTRLQTIQTSQIMNVMGQDFGRYAQFMMSLYDLENTHTEMIMKNGKKVDIHFSKKNIVGKAVDNVTISDMKALEQIRVEFEIDLAKSSPEVEHMLKAITGNAVIRNFFGRQSGVNMPATITDSSKVRIKDKYGNVYEGYLSPVGENRNNMVMKEDDLHSFGDGDPNITGDDPSQVLSSFALYDSPADQLSSTRALIPMKGEGGALVSDGGRNKAVTIHSGNLGEFSSVEVLDKKATLSGSTLGSLSLMNKIAEQYDNRTIDQKQVEQKLDDLDKAQVRTMKQHDGRDKIQDGNMESSEQGGSIHKARGNLFKNKDATPELKVGTRAAIQLNDVATLPGFPPGYLLITVDSIATDGNNLPTDIALRFENLSYSGDFKTTTKTLDATGLKNLKSKINTLKSFALEEITGGTATSYEKTMEKLQKAKENHDLKDRSKGSMSNEHVHFDESKGEFYKKGVQGADNAPVTKFISHASEAGKGLNSSVVYEVSKKGPNKYHIQSTGYGKKPEGHGFATNTTLDGLLLILGSKKATPYTEQEYGSWKSRSAAAGVLPAKDKKWLSFSGIVTLLKGDFTKVADEFKKLRGEEKDKEMRYRVFVETGFYRRVDSWIGPILEYFDLNAPDNLADTDEKAGATGEYPWGKINDTFEHLKAMHHSFNIDVTARDVPLSSGKIGKNTGAGALAYEYITNAQTKHDANNGVVPYKNRFQTAGALLYHLDKYKSGYARYMANMPRGTYVKLMMGDHAYKQFIALYSKKKGEIGSDGSKADNKKQELLNFMEYDFIIDNIRGGANEDASVLSPGGQNRYFMRMYSRKFCGELQSKVASAKNISTDPGSEDIKNIIGTGNFAHAKKDCYEQIQQYRIDEAVQRIVAMSQLASTPKESDEVCIALLTGIMNGAFTKNIGADLKEKLKVVARHNGMLITHWLEHYDCADKVATLLNLASNGGFSKLNIDPNIMASTERAPGVTYDIAKKTQDRLENDKNYDQVMDFIHGSKINDDSKDHNNIFKIRYQGKAKAKNPDLKVKIFDRDVTDTEQKLVNKLMEELYFNTDRGYSIDQNGLGFNYAGGYKRTRTRIHNAYEKMNVLQEGNLTDRGQVMRGAHDAETPRPDQLETKDTQYRLAANVDEFWRILKNVGGIQYNQEQIAMFYRCIRRAKEEKGLSESDRARLLWFYPLSLIYEKGPVPDQVLGVVEKYMKYFETNLGLFDQSLAQMHTPPAASDKTFGYVYDESNFVHYIPKKERDTKTIREQNDRKIKVENKGLILYNSVMHEKNTQAMGTRTYGRGSGTSIGSTIDAKIAAMRGGGGMGYHQSDDENNIPTASNAGTMSFDLGDGRTPDQSSESLERPEKLSKEEKKKQEAADAAAREAQERNSY